MTTVLASPQTSSGNSHRLTKQTETRTSSLPGLLRRNQARVSVGLIVIALSVLGVVALIGRSAERVPVLAVSTEVPAGTSITAADLVEVDLPADTGLPVVAADAANEVIGQAATVTLMRGTLLTRSHLSAEARIPEGMALLGAVLDPGQYPVGLSEGDQVELIETPSTALASAEQLIENHGVAEVSELADPPTGSGALVVSLLVPDDSADEVAAAGAAGHLSLVVVGSR